MRDSIPGMASLTLSGQLDRIDDRHGQVHIVDYKSGPYPWTSRTQRKLEIQLGFCLQPSLYPWLYQQTAKTASPPTFSFIFLGNDPPREVSIEETVNCEELLESLTGLLNSGHYFAVSKETLEDWGLGSINSCRYCEFQSLCRRFDPSRRDGSSFFFQTLAADRHSFMLRQSQEDTNHVEV
jgi:ATP-dependent helicase/DNAse subunit B